MSLSNKHHRRAAAAMNRRQLEFTPTAIFPGETDNGLGSGLGDLGDLGPFGPNPHTERPRPGATVTSRSVLSIATTTSSSSSISRSSTTSSTTSSALSSTLPATSVAPIVVTPTTHVSLVTQPQTDFVTISTTPTLSATVAASSATESATPTSGMSTGVIVGGIGAGVVAVAVIGFAAAYFLRRRRDNDDIQFNPRDFRRSAVLMEDPPTHEDTINAGFNARPPAMAERRLASPVPSFGTQYGAPAPPAHAENYGGYAQNYGAYGNGFNGYGNTVQPGQFQSFTPGQVMPNGPPGMVNPVAPPAVYDQSGFSPISPISPNMVPYNQTYGAQEQAVMGAVLSRKPSYGTSVRKPAPTVTAADLSRQASVAAISAYPAVLHQPDMRGPAQPLSPTIEEENEEARAHARDSNQSNDYVDLNRSSVSPFQAAQYVAISQELNTQVPKGLDTPAVKDFMDRTRDQDDVPPPLPPKFDASPFADPVNQPAVSHRPVSADSGSQDLHFPIPPSPPASFSSRYRVDSMPPTLPEIHLQSRVSTNSYSDFQFPTGRIPAGSSPLASSSLSDISESPFVSRFPMTPSPMASSFGLPTPPVTTRKFDTSSPNSPLANNVSTHMDAHAELTVQNKRPPTLYDADDAYGGI